MCAGAGTMWGRSIFLQLRNPRRPSRTLVLASFSACCSTAFSSFSMEEKRCRISCMRTPMFRMVSICERDAAESECGSSNSNSELPITEVRALFSVCRTSSM